MVTPDEREFAQFVQDSWPGLVRTVVFIGAGVHEAEDLAQQTLIRSHGRWTRVAASEHLSDFAEETS